MRKIISFTLCAALALPLAAQSWDQALMFGENVYGGTARSIGMGNALTAVGGDLGSIGINPAGGAVAGYSQFVVTPGLSISATVAQGSSADGRDPVGLADRVSTGYTRLKLPNIGFSMNMDTGRRHGLKRLSFGFVSNSTNDFTYRMNASGSYYGDYTYTGSLASLAQGFDPKVLWGDWFAEGGKAYEPAWSAMAATQSHIIDHIGDSQYLGVTEALVGKSAGDLWQKYGYQTRGYKQDILLNMSANFDDKFYIGANLGITTLAYTRSEYWEEGPEDKAKFPQLEYDEGAKKATLNSVFTKSMYTVSGIILLLSLN